MRPSRIMSSGEPRVAHRQLGETECPGTPHSTLLTAKERGLGRTDLRFGGLRGLGCETESSSVARQYSRRPTLAGPNGP